MRKLTLFLSFSWLSMFNSLPSLSAELDHAYIENLAKTYLAQHTELPTEGQLNISVTPIDPRIDLKQCDQPLIVNIPEKRNSRNVNIKISCENSTPWRIYLSARITITIPIIIAKNYIAKGSTLDTTNIEVIQRDTLKIRSEYYQKLTNLLGTKAIKAISKGKIVTKKNICLVCKGESVNIKANSASLTIQTKGIALANGTLGQFITVKNSRSGRTISAQITTSNRVEINL